VHAATAFWYTYGTHEGFIGERSSNPKKYKLESQEGGYMIKIAVANQKGGVGKTTLSFNLSNIIAGKKGISVLAIDNDPQGNLTSSFLEDLENLTGNVMDAYDEKPIKPQVFNKSLSFLGADPNLAPVAERDFHVIFRLREALSKLNGQFQYCFIDCLPSFGYLHLAALSAADYVLIPVKPAPYAFAGMHELFKTIEKVRKYHNPDLKVLGIVINQFDGRKPVMEREMEEALREIYGDHVLKAKINKRIKVEESPAFQKAITQYDPKGPAAKEFRTIATEILRRLKNDG